ncbi:DnaJ family domain-containing protein [Streptomyces flavovirens]
MTERKPAGVSFESWVDRQIREAEQRGDFSHLPGFGKPLPGLERTYDENWWIKAKLEREGVSVLPPSLALRKEAEDAREEALEARSEREARRILAEVNERIREALRTPPEGPPLNIRPLDVEAVVAQWHERRA